MAATGKTANYDLPLYQGSDTLNTSDFNNAMIKTDAQMHADAETSETIQAQVTELSGQLETANSTIAALNTDIGLNTADITKNTNDIASNTEEIGQLKPQVSGNASAIQSTQSALQTTNSDVSALTARVTTAEGKITALENNEPDLSGYLTESEASTVYATNARVTQLQTTVNQVEQTADDAAEYNSKISNRGLKILRENRAVEQTAIIINNGQITVTLPDEVVGSLIQLHLIFQYAPGGSTDEKSGIVYGANETLITGSYRVFSNLINIVALGVATTNQITFRIFNNDGSILTPYKVYTNGNSYSLFKAQTFLPIVD